MTVPVEIAERLMLAARKTAEAEDWRHRRNQLIVEAVTAGGTQPEVAKLAGLTQAGVSQIVTRHERGEPDH